MFLQRFAAALAVAITSLASVAGEQPMSLKPTDPAAQVPQTTFTSVLSTYRPAAQTAVSPDKVWREANATVASETLNGGQVMPAEHSGGQLRPEVPVPATTAQAGSAHGQHQQHAEHQQKDAKK